jgi:hypothetical protein
MRPPNANIDESSIFTAGEQRRQIFIDLFGFYMVWARAFVLQQAKGLVESEALRSSLGTIMRVPYERVSKLNLDQQEDTFRLSEKCVDQFAMQMLGFLTNSGNDVRVSNRYSYRLKIDVEIYDVETGELVASENINKSIIYLPKFWFKWVNRYEFKF